MEPDNQKSDWKQWIPYWGMYEVVRDHHNGEPTMLDRFAEVFGTEKQFSWEGQRAFLPAYYHMAMGVTIIPAAVYIGSQKLVEILVERFF